MEMLVIYIAAGFFGLLLGIPLLMFLIGIRYIPHNQLGIIEKLWSPSGSLKGGGIISRH